MDAGLFFCDSSALLLPTAIRVAGACGARAASARSAAARSTRRCAAPKRSSSHFSLERSCEAGRCASSARFHRRASKPQRSFLVSSWPRRASSRSGFCRSSGTSPGRSRRRSLSYASRNYVTSSRGFGMFFSAMLLLEGLALLCLTVPIRAMSVCDFATRHRRMLVVGAVGVGCLTSGMSGGSCCGDGAGPNDRRLNFLRTVDGAVISAM